MKVVAWAILLMVFLAHYGYHFIQGAAPRVFYAMNGLQAVALSLLVLFLMFKRLTDWHATVILTVATIVAIVENGLVFACGAWYAFAYTGPYLAGDKCEVMLNTTLSKPLAYTLVTLALLMLPRIWNKKWAMRHGGI